MDIFEYITKQLSRRQIIFISTFEEQQTSSLDPEEKKYIEDSGLKRQKEYATGRWCAKKAMQKLGVGADMVLVGPNNEPVWQNGITGSISHANQAFCAAVAGVKDLQSIGIDIELKDRKISRAALNLILNDDEKEWLSKTGKNREFFEILIFSAKESLYKMIYPVINRKFFFDAMSISYSQNNWSKRTIQFSKYIADVSRTLLKSYKDFSKSKYSSKGKFGKILKALDDIAKFVTYPVRMLLKPLKKAYPPLKTMYSPLRKMYSPLQKFYEPLKNPDKANTKKSWRFEILGKNKFKPHKRGILEAKLKVNLGEGFEIDKKFDVYYYTDKKWIVTVTFK